ncbi:MAG TPA: ATP-binding protein [Verrucomicrobiae bacterium]|nr:ATP-binding protein [Verrucomicrobiae bacterium]
MKNSVFLCAVILALQMGTSRGELTNKIEIQSVAVGNKNLTVPENKSVNLGIFPPNVTFRFGPPTNSHESAVRVRYKLEGYDTNWNEGGSEMYLAIRFYDEAGTRTDQQFFYVRHHSADWNGSLKDSPLAHRRETITVPAKATHASVVISSAGPPDTVGIYVVSDLELLQISSDNATSVLMRDPLNHQSNSYEDEHPPPGWTRDGITPGMAKIVNVGNDLATKAFAILDDSLIGHAEWRTVREGLAPVSPGSKLTIEWNEMYSMGIGGLRFARYGALPTGTYQFHVVGLNLMGETIGDEASLTVLVAPPFWRAIWFWILSVVVLFIVTLATTRYVTWNNLQREMLQLKSQQALERERLRIANNIHDDLGARVTQISMLAAMAKDNTSFSEAARNEFDQISLMTRELVSALYETVWAVDPENDNLDALGNYICQMVNQLCNRAPIRCRFHFGDMPREIEIPSNVRHNISLAIKEAVHNVIKHAKATEVTVTVEFSEADLTISVHDNGCGFAIADNNRGNGLKNIKRRLESIGGLTMFESKMKHGTTVHLKLTIAHPNNTPRDEKLG